MPFRNEPTLGEQVVEYWRKRALRLDAELASHMYAYDASPDYDLRSILPVLREARKRYEDENGT
jgi:hypothetical protein